MRKSSISIVELHVEKAVVGLAALFMLYMVISYLAGSPNTIEYAGETVAPGELDAKILEKAQRLERAVASAQPEKWEDPRYLPKVRDTFERSILASADNAPPVLADLPVSAAWDKPIGVPGESVGARKLAVVPAVSPTKPIITRGRSELEFEQLNLYPETTSDTSDKDLKPTAHSWVTIAAYWNRTAQQEAHVAAGYQSWNQTPYITGVEVQRQWQHANGDWSEWETVKADKAYPRLVVPEPTIDPATGELSNRAEISAAFEAVRNNELQLAQPPFFEVTRGDQWFVPPLMGHDESSWPEEKEEEKDNTAGKDDAPRGRSPYGPPSGYGGGPPGGYGGGGPPGGYGGGRRTPYGGRERPQEEKRDEKKEAEIDYWDSVRNYINGSYEEAVSLADQVIENKKVSTRMKRKAEAMKERATFLVRQTKNAAPTGDQISHPDDPGQVAVWYHDDTAVLGRLYRYRIRVNLWNRFFNKPSQLADPHQAESTLVPGEWSEPSDPVTVIPEACVFVKNCRDEGKTARVSVWKWVDGWWVDEDFDIGVGDPIGGVAKVAVPRTDDELREAESEVDQEKNPYGAERTKEVELDFNTGAVFMGGRSEDRDCVITYVDAYGETREKAQERRIPDLNFEPLD